jgi:hypothetical protein
MKMAVPPPAPLVRSVRYKVKPRILGSGSSARKKVSLTKMTSRS